MMSPALTSFGPSTSMRSVFSSLRVHPEEDFLEVQDDVGDVLGDLGDGGELVLHALDASPR